MCCFATEREKQTCVKGEAAKKMERLGLNEIQPSWSHQSHPFSERGCLAVWMQICNVTPSSISWPRSARPHCPQISRRVYYTHWDLCEPQMCVEIRQGAAFSVFRKQALTPPSVLLIHLRFANILATTLNIQQCEKWKVSIHFTGI